MNQTSIFQITQRYFIMINRIGLIGLLLCLAFIPLDATVVDVLSKLEQRSKETGSDVVLVTRQGRPVFEYYSCDKYPTIDTREMTRSFISLAIGLLIDEGKIQCLDAPVHVFYPEWNRGLYKKITLRHLLNNTSGLEIHSCNDLCTRPSDKIKYALCDPLIYCPGTRYFIHQNAMALLVGIIQKASGKEVHDYLGEKLFVPLDIQSASWVTYSDKGDFGSPRLVIPAVELVKVGELISNKGMWGNKRIISERWLQESTKPSQGFDPFFGLQWWLEFYDVECYWDAELIRAYYLEGISPDLIERLKSLQRRVIHFGGQIWGNYIIRLWGPELNTVLGGEYHISRFLNEVRERGLPMGNFRAGGLKSIIARGKGGQQLIIMPKQRLVAVRQKILHPRSEQPDLFEDLPELMDALSRECDAYID